MQFFQLEHFASYVNETFRVRIDQHGETDFVLVEAAPIPQGKLFPGMVRTPFSLLFRNESAVLFPQRIYDMTHGKLGQFGVFLVPIARDKSGFVYQAVFN
ncbi:MULTISPECIES: DUF6916 family protein [Dyella]|uniref:DUF6916 domain-containing protein n=2 Tax=Dyella TaxID=231454 RepID=A0A4R0YPL0_9GAMM|nr:MULTISPECIES: hypothetical protein [Dyella]TBR35962.1 hypothetical protein EYV96_18415 [Dyella terrae]TCI08491.1 hypothetical protein EZM97_28140 [Dyella soli]